MPNQNKAYKYFTNEPLEEDDERILDILKNLGTKVTIKRTTILQMLLMLYNNGIDVGILEELKESEIIFLVQNSDNELTLLNTFFSLENNRNFYL